MTTTMTTTMTAAVHSALPSAYPGMIYNGGTFEPPTSNSQFAFARVISGDICLVQVPSTQLSTSLSPVNVKFFRHELITIFRFSHSESVHPAHISIVEPIEGHHVKFEEETGCVFLAKDIMDKLRCMIARRESMTRRPSQLRRWS